MLLMLTSYVTEHRMLLNSPRRESGPVVSLLPTDNSVFCRRSREAPAANQRHYRDSTLNIVLPDLTFQSDGYVNIIKV